MSADIRSHTRIPKKLQVDLVRSNGTQIRETVLAQNVSASGVRVATEKIWRPGERVLLSPHDTGVPAPARVVYCERLENGNFAVGLQLLDPGNQVSH